MYWLNLALIRVRSISPLCHGEYPGDRTQGLICYRKSDVSAYCVWMVIIIGLVLHRGPMSICVYYVKMSILGHEAFFFPIILDIFISSRYLGHFFVIEWGIFCVPFILNFIFCRWYISYFLMLRFFALFGIMAVKRRGFYIHHENHRSKKIRRYEGLVPHLYIAVRSTGPSVSSNGKKIPWFKVISWRHASQMYINSIIMKVQTNWHSTCCLDRIVLRISFTISMTGLYPHITILETSAHTSIASSKVPSSSSIGMSKSYSLVMLVTWPYPISHSNRVEPCMIISWPKNFSASRHSMRPTSLLQNVEKHGWASARWYKTSL